MSLIRRIQQSQEGPEAPLDLEEPAPGAALMADLARERARELHDWMVDNLAGDLDAIERSSDPQRGLAGRIQELYRTSNVTLSPEDQRALFREIQEDLLGYGPLAGVLADDSVQGVMVNGPHRVFIEREGRLALSEITFRDDAHVRRIIERILRPLGRPIDRRWPLVDARLPDGSRVNAILPPCALDGSSITIRKFPKKRLTMEDLIRLDALSPEMAEFLRAGVGSHLNIVIAGSTGSGKTTLLNILAGAIPEHERIVTIEESAELQLPQPHVVRLESKGADRDGQGAVTIRDLVRNSLRMRPDRLIVGECRGDEVLELIQAMNTGYDGSLTTTPAHTPRDAMDRLETLSLMGGLDLPQRVLREQLAAAVDLIVQQSRLRDGSRRITSISEVQGMEGNTIVLQELFAYEESGMDESQRVQGSFHASGSPPRVLSRLEEAGFPLPPELFTPSSQRRLY